MIYLRGKRQLLEGQKEETKMRMFLRSFLLINILSSCSLFEGKEANKNSYVPIWEYNFDIGYFASIDPILHKKNVIFSALDEKKNDFSANSTLEAFDKDNGELIWKWDETIDNSYDQFNYSAQNYVYNNSLYISTGVDYAIDLINGKTVHYLDLPKFGGQSFYGREDLIFSAFYTKNDES